MTAFHLFVVGYIITIFAIISFLLNVHALQCIKLIQCILEFLKYFEKSILRNIFKILNTFKKYFNYFSKYLLPKVFKIQVQNTHKVFKILFKDRYLYFKYFTILVTG